MKIAAYCCTRNWYEHLQVSIFSLLMNSPRIDKVIVIAEDDELPFNYDKVECINYSSLPHYIKESSPNFKGWFSYMSLQRPCYAKWFDYDKVLQLDVDTIILDDLSELWEIDMTGKAMAGAEDVMNPLKEIDRYLNVGVVLQNLDYIRENKIADLVIDDINSRKRPWADQDAMNLYCNNNIVVISTKYNDFTNARRTVNPKILHWAGVHDWYIEDSCYYSEVWQEYKHMMVE